MVPNRNKHQNKKHPCKRVLFINSPIKNERKPLMNQDVILFDLDGTLTGSAEGIVNSVIYALEHMGIPYESKESLRCFIGPPLQTSFRDHCKLSEEQRIKEFSHTD